MSSTSRPRVTRCRMCGKPEHGTIACQYATDWTIEAHGPPTRDLFAEGFAKGYAAGFRDGYEQGSRAG